MAADAVHAAAGRRSTGDSLAPTLADSWIVRSMSVRRRGCQVDADCARMARCLRRLPPAADPPVPRYAAVCRCVHPAAMGDHNLTASSAATSSTAPTAATRGHCIQTRVLGQPCHFDVDCSPGMVCSVPDYLCDCAMGLRYSRQRARCEADPGRHHDPWTLDLPPIADMDAEVVETIPATYDCPLLVGMISVVLVLICLVVAAYCRFTDPPPKPPGYRPARTEREEGEPFEWGESSPLRSSWGGESDLSSLRRVKQCSCDLAQASAQAAAAAAAQPPDPPTPDGHPELGVRPPRSPRPVPPPRVPTYAGLRSPESPVDVLGAHMDPLGLRRTLPSQVQLPPTPSLRGSVRVYMPQLPAGVVRAGR